MEKEVATSEIFEGTQEFIPGKTAAKIMKGKGKGVKGIFLGTKPSGHIFAGRPVIRITEGPQEDIGIEIPADDVGCIVAAEKVKKLGDLPPGTRIRFRNEGDRIATVTDEKPEKYPDHNRVVLYDDGEKWIGSITAEVEVVSE